MATTTSITTTYAGEKMAGFISAALLSANSLDRGGMEAVSYTHLTLPTNREV